MTPNSDSDPDRGIVWMNIIGLGAVLFLLILFFVLYGGRLWDFLTWLWDGGGADAWMRDR